MAAVGFNTNPRDMLDGFLETPDTEGSPLARIFDTTPTAVEGDRTFYTSRTFSPSPPTIWRLTDYSRFGFLSEGTISTLSDKERSYLNCPTIRDLIREHILPGRNIRKIDPEVLDILLDPEKGPAIYKKIKQVQRGEKALVISYSNKSLITSHYTLLFNGYCTLSQLKLLSRRRLTLLLSDKVPLLVRLGYSFNEISNFISHENVLSLFSRELFVEFFARNRPSLMTLAQISVGRVLLVPDEVFFLLNRKVLPLDYFLFSEEKFTIVSSHDFIRLLTTDKIRFNDVKEYSAKECQRLLLGAEFILAGALTPEEVIRLPFSFFDFLKEITLRHRPSFQRDLIRDPTQAKICIEKPAEFWSDITAALPTFNRLIDYLPRELPLTDLSCHQVYIIGKCSHLVHSDGITREIVSELLELRPELADLVGRGNLTLSQAKTIAKKTITPRAIALLEDHILTYEDITSPSCSSDLINALFLNRELKDLVLQKRISKPELLMLSSSDLKRLIAISRSPRRDTYEMLLQRLGKTDFVAHSPPKSSSCCTIS